MVPASAGRESPFMRGVIKGPPDVYWGYYQKRQAWYFGQAGKAGVTLSISNYIWALRLNSGGGQLLHHQILSASFPRDRRLCSCDACGFIDVFWSDDRRL